MITAKSNFFPEIAILTLSQSFRKSQVRAASPSDLLTFSNRPTIRASIIPIQQTRSQGKTNSLNFRLYCISFLGAIVSIGNLPPVDVHLFRRRLLSGLGHLLTGSALGAR
jgi:hypothetical protein